MLLALAACTQQRGVGDAQTALATSPMTDAGSDGAGARRVTGSADGDAPAAAMPEKIAAGSPFAIVADPRGLWWIDEPAGRHGFRVLSCAVDGSNLRVVAERKGKLPWSLALTRSHVLWTETDRGSVDYVLVSAPSGGGKVTQRLEAGMLPLVPQGEGVLLSRRDDVIVAFDPATGAVRPLASKPVPETAHGTGLAVWADRVYWSARATWSVPLSGGVPRFETGRSGRLVVTDALYLHRIESEPVHGSIVASVVERLSAGPAPPTGCPLGGPHAFIGDRRALYLRSLVQEPFSDEIYRIEGATVTPLVRGLDPLPGLAIDAHHLYYGDGTGLYRLRR